MDEFILDEQRFVEQWHPNYNCQDIADEGDMALVLDGEWRFRPDDENEHLQEYINMPVGELEKERKKLWGKILQDSMDNFLRKNYPEMFES